MGNYPLIISFTPSYLDHCFNLMLFQFENLGESKRHTQLANVIEHKPEGKPKAG